MDEDPLIQANRRFETSQKWATRMAWLDLIPYLAGTIVTVLILCTCGLYLVMDW